ncbi:hypothetical protein GCM10011341_12150 [Frigidibacter albus]|nr:hypothetical protein GCM10011341_12150 [Frigidibacter albus]
MKEAGGPSAPGRNIRAGGLLPPAPPEDISTSKNGSGCVEQTPALEQRLHSRQAAAEGGVEGLGFL